MVEQDKNLGVLSLSPATQPSLALFLLTVIIPALERSTCSRRTPPPQVGVNRKNYSPTMASAAINLAQPSPQLQIVSSLAHRERETKALLLVPYTSLQ